jgi:hypothetical protein
MRYIKLILLLLIFSRAVAQEKLVKDYILNYHEIATSEMHRTGIPVSIKLAQGMLESSYGQSELAVIGNNHFGIKCHSSWTGEKYYKHDDEFCEEGNKKESCFRVYSQPQESFYDHSVILKAKRYAFLYEYDSKDYVSWANGLLKAGYATDPQYANKLIGMIEKHELYKLDESNQNYQDLIADIPVKEKSKAKKESAPVAVDKEETAMKEDRHSVFDVFRKKDPINKKSNRKDEQNNDQALAYADGSRRNKQKTAQTDAFTDNADYLFDEALTPKSK